ncbi:MAG: hypothetical protein ACI9YB_003181 [Halioglobus sp.]|jgi:hypothetical protein
MIQLKLSEEEITELNNGPYEHSDPTIQKCLNALYSSLNLHCDNSRINCIREFCKLRKRFSHLSF